MNELFNMTYEINQVPSFPEKIQSLCLCQNFRLVDGNTDMSGTISERMAIAVIGLESNPGMVRTTYPSSCKKISISTSIG